MLQAERRTSRARSSRTIIGFTLSDMDDNGGGSVAPARLLALPAAPDMPDMRVVRRRLGVAHVALASHGLLGLVLHLDPDQPLRLQLRRQ